MSDIAAHLPNGPYYADRRLRVAKNLHWFVFGPGSFARIGFGDLRPHHLRYIERVLGKRSFVVLAIDRASLRSHLSGVRGMHRSRRAVDDWHAEWRRHRWPRGAG